MAQWIDLNQNNRYMLAHRYSVSEEKTGPILLPLVRLTAGRDGRREGGRQAGRRNVGGF